MEQTLSVQNIGSKYKKQWVFMLDCKFKENGELCSGRVALHSPNKEEVYNKLSDFQDYKGKTAIRYTGKIPDDLTLL